MSAPIRTWVPVPGWWIPVWVTLDDAAGSTDVLEQSVVALVRAGLRTPEEVARELCIHRALVESACATLISADILRVEEGALVAAVEPHPEEVTRARSGFIAWDLRAQRPLLQLWLEGALPDPGQPRGWRVERWEEPDPYPRAPAKRDVVEFLRLLPSAGGLRVLEPRAGDGVHETDGARVHRVRLRDARWLRGPLWAAVEQRVQGPVVWRPALLPLADVETELDPTGWDGLIGALEGAARVGVEAARTECLDEIAPGVLREVGFSSVEDLRASARRLATQELGDAPRSPAVAAAVEEAYMLGRLGLAIGADWRRMVQAWAHVLEVLTREVTDALAPWLTEVPEGRLAPDEEQRARAVLGGKTTSLVQRALRKPDDLAAVRRVVAQDIASIGDRLLAWGLCIATIPPVRRAFETAWRGEPTLFDELDRARDERNRGTHVRGDGDDVDINGHRARVLRVCAALLRLELPSAGKSR